MYKILTGKVNKFETDIISGVSIHDEQTDTYKHKSLAWFPSIPIE